MLPRRDEQRSRACSARSICAAALCLAPPLLLLFLPLFAPPPDDSPHVSRSPIDMTPPSGLQELNNPTPGMSRGFAFVDFFNEHCAAEALKRLQAADFAIRGRKPTVNIAEPPRGQAAAQQVSSHRQCHAHGYSTHTMPHVFTQNPVVRPCDNQVWRPHNEHMMTIQ